MITHPKIAYIGGGSKMWARIFMNDLALDDAMCGEIALYDIDIEAAKRNEILGHMINHHPLTVSKWNYSVAQTIEECLNEATFVVLSILPGTFAEMQSDVHEPESVGIYQTVGDTVGPGGVLRAMRTVPLYEFFASKIKEICPNALVINLTNPMSICVKTLYDVFPQIKAFGCCHEVFHAQEFLGMVVEERLGLKSRPTRKQIEIDVAGINHFTDFKSLLCESKRRKNRRFSDASYIY
jgi:alpha-galactosidase